MGGRRHAYGLATEASVGPKKKQTGLGMESRANLCLGLLVVSTCLLIDSAPGQCPSGEEVEDVEANRC